MMDQIKAPFTQEQCDELNDYQTKGKFHPFTCLNDGDVPHIMHEFETQNKGKDYNKDYNDYIQSEKAKGINYPEASFTQTNLIATKDGWICPVCDYKQYWAHKFMSEK